MKQNPYAGLTAIGSRPRSWGEPSNADGVPAQHQITVPGGGRVPDALSDGYNVTPPTRARTFSVFVSSNPLIVLLNDTTRRNLEIQNVSGDTIYFAFGAAPQLFGSTYIGGHILASLQTYSSPAGWAPTNELYIVSSGTDSHVVLSEMIVSGVG